MLTGTGLMQGATELNTGQEHHCLMWTPALSYENGITCLFTDKATEAQEDDLICPRSQCHQNPGHPAPHCPPARVTHFPVWNLPRWFTIQVVLPGPFTPPKSEGIKQLTFKGVAGTWSSRRKANTSWQPRLLRARASEITFSTKQKTEILMNLRAAVIYSKWENQLMLVSEEASKCSRAPGASIHTGWRPFTHLQL